MTNINKVSICLNSAQPDVVERQVAALDPLAKELSIHYNKRIDRNAGAYNSYSELINEQVVNARYEYLVFINDDILPTPDDVRFLLGKLEDGFGVASLASIGFMALTKEVFRVVGWWDERFLGGGYEDDDFVLKLRCHEIGYYESHSAKQDRSVRGKNPKPPWLQYPLQYSGAHFAKKWAFDANHIEQRLPDESYAKYNDKLGSRHYDISKKWKTWDETVAWVDFDQARISAGLIGPSRTYWFRQVGGHEHNKVSSPYIAPRGWNPHG